MSGRINHLEQLYQQALRDPDALERNAGDYPCSSLAGFLLLYHYKRTNHPGFEKLSKKTALHFRNINWLQFLLDEPSNENNGLEIISPAYPEDENGTANVFTATEVQMVPGQHPGNGILEGIENNSLPETTEAPEEVEINAVAGTFVAEAGIGETPDAKKEQPEIINAASEEIAFEPLHTVDYFASQGIKITDEPETTDKLGNQMKSFTAWLKSMKKLHPSKAAEQDLAVEKQIQNSAEESNINSEILTEAMAEVLIKQDKREKAIEMYNKLSLINPSKSAYFAAKIESIKSS